MNVAIMASVNNDPLAALIIAATLYVLLRWIGREVSGQKSESPEHGGRSLPLARRLSQFPIRNATLLFLGLLVGLGFLTKATTYILLPVVVVTVFFVSWWRAGWRRALIHVAAVSVWALLLGLPFWLRNIYLYGGFDFLGLAWHDQVVAGQPTRLDWIAANGWPAYWERAWRFTFDSFWGVFGWMGVFMDGRIYSILLLFSGLIALALLILLIQVRQWLPSLSHAQRGQLAALFLLLAAVAASYIWYNLGFVQHQGRYLFPALLPIGLLVAIGWRALLRPLNSLIGAIFLLLAALVLAGLSIGGGSVDRWMLLFMAGGVAILLIYATLVLRFNWWGRPPVWIEALPFVLLVLLDIAIPFLYIGPQLG